MRAIIGAIAISCALGYAALADGPPTPASSGWVNAQSTTPGTQQASTNFSISGVSLIGTSELVGQNASPSAVFHITRAAAATPSSSLAGSFLLTSPADTALTLSVEVNDFSITGATKQWATGALTNQRYSLFGQPTASFAGGSTITDAATVDIVGAPVAGTSATLTNSHALRIEAGAVAAGTTSSYGLTVNAQTGAGTRNVAAQFMGGAVGVGTATPTAGAGNLDVTGSLHMTAQTTAGYVKNDGAGLYSGGNTTEREFSAYNSANVAAATALSETTVTNASTVTTGSKITTDIAGVGAGNFVVMLCTDGTTCAGGNQRATWTQACTAAAGTRTAATIQNGGTIAASSVITMSVTTACATTDPGVNINAHITSP